MWMAGGGVKGGITHGKTDELGFNAVEGAVHTHDLNATLLHLLGLDHATPDLPLPRPRLPPHGCARGGGEADFGLIKPALLPQPTPTPTRLSSTQSQPRGRRVHVECGGAIADERDLADEGLAGVLAGLGEDAARWIDEGADAGIGAADEGAACLDGAEGGEREVDAGRG